MATGKHPGCRVMSLQALRQIADKIDRELEERERRLREELEKRYGGRRTLYVVADGRIYKSRPKASARKVPRDEAIARALEKELRGARARAAVAKKLAILYPDAVANHDLTRVFLGGGNYVNIFVRDGEPWLVAVGTDAEKVAKSIRTFLGLRAEALPPKRREAAPEGNS